MTTSGFYGDSARGRSSIATRVMSGSSSMSIVGVQAPLELLGADPEILARLVINQLVPLRVG
jgi:hypothetical protein